MCSLRTPRRNNKALTEAQLKDVGIVGPDGDGQNEDHRKPFEDRYANVALVVEKVALLRADELILPGVIDALVYVHVGGRAVIDLRHFDI